MNRSSSSTGIAFPLPGSPGSSWAMYRARFKAIFHGADTSVLMAFWLFGMLLRLEMATTDRRRGERRTILIGLTLS